MALKTASCQLSLDDWGSAWYTIDTLAADNKPLLIPEPQLPQYPVAHIRFWDHCSGSTAPILQEIFGRILANRSMEDGPKYIVVRTSGTIDPEPPYEPDIEADLDTNTAIGDQNETIWIILVSAIDQLRILEHADDDGVSPDPERAYD